MQDRVAGTRINRQLSSQGSGNPRTALSTSSHGKREPDKTAGYHKSGEAVNPRTAIISACRLLGLEFGRSSDRPFPGVGPRSCGSAVYGHSSYKLCPGFVSFPTTGFMNPLGNNLSRGS